MADNQSDSMGSTPDTAATPAAAAAETTTPVVAGTTTPVVAAGTTIPAIAGTTTPAIAGTTAPAATATIIATTTATTSTTTSTPAAAAAAAARRPFEEDIHAPAVSSPLNPNPSNQNATLSRPAKPMVREQREKKDSLKKREAAARGTTPEAKAKMTKPSSTPSPMRYSIPDPRNSDFDPPKEPMFSSHEPSPIFTPDGQAELKKSIDHAENKKAYRYSHCVADPLFVHKQYYRQSETAPFSSRMSVEDSDRNMHFDPSTRIVTNEKGWRMSRANVFAREGSLYYEVKILKGPPVDGPVVPPGQEHLPQPHIRMGWARREAPLDAPVGFDGYSYGVTDIRFESMHRSRSAKFLSPQNGKSKAKSKKQQQQQQQQDPQDLLQTQLQQQDVRTNDIIGLLITLPPLALHRKVVTGVYNPAVDFSTSAPDPSAPAPDIIRDRIPVPYRGNVYFEQFEYQPIKPMLTYSDRAPVNLVSPHPNHEDPALRCLPGSSIKVYKNGIFVGTAFQNLMAFLPPASVPSGQGVRQGFDDGSLGYYPAVSAFSGGMAEMNFGPDFWCPPAELNLSTEATADVHMEGAPDQSPAQPDVPMHPRAISHRYREQVAEDIVWDIIDESDFFVQDGGFGYVPETTETFNLPSLITTTTTTLACGNLQDDGESPANSSPINSFSMAR